MNKTERAALVDRAELADRIAALITLRTQWSPTDRALEIIDTVLAARDAEIRERLDLIYDEVRCENTDGMGGQDQHTAGYLEGLSVAIGLLTHGDGTGGQG